MPVSYPAREIYGIQFTMPRLALGEAPHIQSAGYSPTGYQMEEKSSGTGFWHFHLYLYKGEIKGGSGWLAFEPGWASLVPAGRDHQVRRPQRSPHWWVRFRVVGSPAPHLAFPEVWDLADLVGPVTEGLSRVSGVLATEPHLARARFWAILLELGRGPGALTENIAPDRLGDALRYLEQHTDSPKPVAFLAQRLGVTEGHVIRLFRKRFGTTPAAWRRKRFAERARLLLTESHLSPKQVAEELGIRDLQHFNKLLRRELGQSPRTLREKKVSLPR